jgi:hypothetical protein
MKTGAPDDVGHLEHAAALEYWQAVLDADDARGPLDAGGDEVTRLCPDEWAASVQL